MNKIFKGILSVVVLATMVSVTSCTKTCDKGYEGSDCKTEVRTKFAGTYSASDNPGALVYSVTVASGTSISDVVISSNFSDSYFVNNVKGTVDGSILTIARQQPDNDNYFVEGTGTLSGKTITWSYKIINATVSPETSISYTGTWTKP